ncbi:MAG: hypothetical protein V3T22_12910 [Planctomycetota bacterium]
MKVIPKTRPSRRIFLLLATVLSLLVGLPGTGAAGGDGTIGGLPSADGGDGSQNFYLTGPRALLQDVILDAYGQGFVVLIDLPGEELWIEFYGDVCLLLDEALLDAHPELGMGLTPGFNGGGMVVVPEIDDVLQNRSWFVSVGFSMPTPYDGIRDLLDGQFSMHSLQVDSGGRGEVSYSASRGMLTVCQKFK